MNKELSRYQSSLTNMSGHNFILAFTYINVMRNKDSHLKIKTKLETTLGYQLESHAETGLWVEKGKQPVLSFPLLSKRIPDKVTVERVRKPPQASSKTKSLRLGFLSIQEKNILKSSQFFTGGLINFYAGQRLPHFGITYQPVERLQRQFNVVTGAMIQCEEESLDSFKCAGHVTYSRTHV